MKDHKPLSSKKPPKPDDRHQIIADWIADAKPSLLPIVENLDQLIRKQLNDPRYSVKWGKAYYGAAEQGWCIELVAYDVSVNVVFLNGSKLDAPPKLGDETRYVKIHSIEDLESRHLKNWIKQSCHMSGWAW
jgi:hypothetical protein